MSTVKLHQSRTQFTRIVRAWIVDLRTTTTPQTKAYLFRPSTGGYCCLGRLCLVTGEPERLANHSAPCDIDNPIANETWFSVTRLMDHVLKDEPGTSPDANPANWNDDLNLTFQEIADMLDILLLELRTATNITWSKS